MAIPYARWPSHPFGTYSSSTLSPTLAAECRWRKHCWWIHLRSQLSLRDLRFTFPNGGRPAPHALPFSTDSKCHCHLQVSLVLSSLWAIYSCIIQKVWAFPGTAVPSASANESVPTPVRICSYHGYSRLPPCSKGRSPS